MTSYKKTKVEQLGDDEVKVLMADEEVARFLDYDCNYKKHKGEKWGKVFNKDRQYFQWVMTIMNPNTRTFQVLSKLCPASVTQKNKVNTAFKVQKTSV